MHAAVLVMTHHFGRRVVVKVGGLVIEQAGCGIQQEAGTKGGLALVVIVALVVAATHDYTHLAPDFSKLLGHSFTTCCLSAKNFANL